MRADRLTGPAGFTAGRFPDSDTQDRDNAARPNRKRTFLLTKCIAVSGRFLDIVFCGKLVPYLLDSSAERQKSSL